MSREFQRGHKARISDLTAGTDLYVGVQIAGPGLTFDISCFGLDADERLSDDRYFVFFNQPKSPEESIQLLGAQAGDTESFRVTLDRVPEAIHKLSFTATIDGAGQMSQVGPGYIRIVAGGEEVARYAFSGAEFSTERAVMLGDFYRKDGWRFAAVGQGFDGGLEALLKNFGGEVLEEEQPQQAPQAVVPQQDAPGFAPPPGGSVPPQQAQPAPGFAAPAPAPAPAPPPAAAPAPAPVHTPPPAPAPAQPQQPLHAQPTMVGPVTPQAPPAPHAPAPQVPSAPQAPTPPPAPYPQQHPHQPHHPQHPHQPGAPYGHVPGQTPPHGAPGPYGQPAPYAQPAPGPYGQQPPMGMPPGAPHAPAPHGAPQGAGLAAALQKYRETPTGQRWTSQNAQLMRVDLAMGQTPVLARQGSMVMYQGKVDFGYKGAGFAGRIVGNATGQEMQLMRCTGRGQVFLAENSAHLHPIELQGDGICVSAENVLAFDESLHHEVRRVEGHGIPGGALFTMLFQGTGTVVVKTQGIPVVLPVTPTTFADCNAVVAWSAASQVVLSSQVRLRRNAYPGHSGETVNLQFRGAPGNFIVVQPYEV
ncbi:TerD family protein [Streptomyces thermolilacinus]|uniref:Stress protein n=1 Tax=Streptomyces thermolilacinus SPC6 TaxID=1306406 RepID=A0A1D3DQ93_9ACTN|nr:TerD family protein [Streptomyces thermolilacinus]OEJ94498.1 stress protein [Streptomyces thermolilacinus SPC6]